MLDLLRAFNKLTSTTLYFFSWNFKGFELLRRYLVKHPTGVYLQNLDLELVDQEMATDEAAQSSAPEDNAAEKTPADDATTAVVSYDAAVDPRI